MDADGSRAEWKDSLRGIGVVAAGYATMALCIAGITAVLGRAFPASLGGEGGGSPGPAWLSVNLAYSAACAAFGGWVTALLARDRPQARVVSLAGLLLVLGVVSTLVYRGQHPLWYQAALLVLGPPAALAGGRLHTGRLWKEPSRERP